VEKIRSALEIRSVMVAEKEPIESLIGHHKWDVLEHGNSNSLYYILLEIWNIG
jgi:hypothetical protein